MQGFQSSQNTLHSLPFFEKTRTLQLHDFHWPSAEHRSDYKIRHYFKVLNITGFVEIPYFFVKTLPTAFIRLLIHTQQSKHLFSLRCCRPACQRARGSPLFQSQQSKPVPQPLQFKVWQLSKHLPLLCLKQMYPNVKRGGGGQTHIPSATFLKSGNTLNIKGRFASACLSEGLQTTCTFQEASQSATGKKIIILLLEPGERNMILYIFFPYLF